MSNQGYCQTQGNLLYQPQPLDLTPEAPFLIPFPPIRLLIKDTGRTTVVEVVMSPYNQVFIAFSWTYLIPENKSKNITFCILSSKEVFQ